MSMPRDWKSVPESVWEAWREVFDQAPSGLDVAGACPVCRVEALHRWFMLPRPFSPDEAFPGCKGRGGQWQWCSSCYSFFHYSGLVPDWWECNLLVDPDTLTHDPEAIEVARLARLSG